MFEKHSSAIVTLGAILLIGLIAGLLWFTFSNQSGELGKGLNLQADIAFILDKYAQAPQEIKNSYQVEGAALVQPPPDENGVRVEIKSSVASDSAPSVQFSRWDGEVKLEVKPVLSSAELKDKTLSFENEKIKVTTAKTDYRFYELPKDRVNAEVAYEIDAVLKEKPASNVISFDIETQNLDFFYQPPLNQEKHRPNVVSCTATQCFDKNGKAVINRPENVVGSYAVYYKNNVSGDYTALGGKNYMTGKAFHIYRPQIIDAQGNKVWGELNVDTQNNKMTITVPQNFLAKATYPVTVDPTFGNASALTTDTSSYDWIDRIVSQTSGGAGTVTKISVKVFPSLGSPKIAAAIYLTSDRSLKGYTEEWTISADGWHDLAMVSGGTIVSDNYDLTMWNDSTVGVNVEGYYYDTGSEGVDMSDLLSYNYPNWPDPVNAGSIAGAQILGIYATYEAVCGDGTCSSTENCANCAADCGACPPGAVDIRPNVNIRPNVSFRAPGVVTGPSYLMDETFSGSALCYTGFASVCDKAGVWTFADVSAVFAAGSLAMPGASGAEARAVASSGSDTMYVAVRMKQNVTTINTFVPIVLDASLNTLCQMIMAGPDGALVIQNIGGTQQSYNLPGGWAADTYYDIKVKAVKGTGANATCQAWYSAAGANSWTGTPISNDGTWTAQPAGTKPTGPASFGTATYSKVRMDSTDINF